MSLVYGAKFVSQTTAENRPHVFAFQTPRGSNDSLFEVWNDEAGADPKFLVFPSRVEIATDLRPDADGSRDLGAENRRWNKVWGGDADLSGALAVAGLITTDGKNVATAEGLSDHVGNDENPHDVTKSQVGLGDVSNFEVASQGEAEAGTASNRYMTPQRTLQAQVYDLAFPFGDADADAALLLTVGRDLAVSGVASSVDSAPDSTIVFEASINGGTAFDLLEIDDEGDLSVATPDPFPFNLDAGDTLEVIAPGDLDGADGISFVLEGRRR